MTDIQLKKLKRVELLELLVEQGEELEQTRERLRKAEEALASRQLRMQNAGTMAEAALTLNDVFAAADQAAKDYLAAVQSMKEEQARLLEQMRARAGEGESPQ